MDIVPVNVSVETLFTRLAGSRPAQLAAKQLTLVCQSGSLAVQGDPDLLEQALGNLLDNAIDFTPEGGAIQLAAREMQDRVQLTVTDSGSGIPDYALDRIFERFYSLPRENGVKSSGLGLAFVQEVARLHRGDYAAQPGGGRRHCHADASPSLHIASNWPHTGPVRSPHHKGDVMMKSPLF